LSQLAIWVGHGWSRLQTLEILHSRKQRLRSITVSSEAKRYLKTACLKFSPFANIRIKYFRNTNAKCVSNLLFTLIFRKFVWIHLCQPYDDPT